MITTDPATLFIPVSREMLPYLEQWSGPVQVRIEDHGGTKRIVCRDVPLDAIDVATLRTAASSTPSHTFVHERLLSIAGTIESALPEQR